MTDQNQTASDDNENTGEARRTARIRELNDRFRTLQGGKGQILVTQGVQALGDAAMAVIFHKVRTFDDFSEDNDPYGEHDFGSFKQADKTIYWKIDYYGLTLDVGSENPADETVTTRVMTILLASEW
ncbi:MAG: hypothetical protein DHS20C03_09020 [Minwuia thermotolerans]|nr:MAG: hypothetical protein DHS20C03_09020 [Minwuia thermotolerans]